MVNSFLQHLRFNFVPQSFPYQIGNLLERILSFPLRITGLSEMATDFAVFS